ncbi:MAG: hypothetical protein MZV70_63840 [Desulfobacterales bacterium]|nr:hypothetical protein [Desulfobacterales bacterium]
MPLVILVRGWFSTRIGTAVGIATAGISMGIAHPDPDLPVPHRRTRLALGATACWAAAVVGWLVPATLWLLRERPAARELPAGTAE